MPDVKLYPEVPENPYISDSVLYTLPEGWKRYELTNHLGNVLAVITDRKRGQAALLGQSVRKLKINHNLLVSVCNATRTVIKSPTSAKK